MYRYLFVLLLAALAAFSPAVFAKSPAFDKHMWAARESVEVSDLFFFGTFDKSNGAVTLVRDFRRQKIEATVTSNALTPGDAYSMWWVVFNFPKYCATPYMCASSDLEINGGDPRIRASVFLAGGFLADALGGGNTSLSLTRGRTTRELFAQSKDYGLQNLRGAEIHLVLRTHGTAGVAGPVAKQIGTAGEACPMSGCVNQFFSIHPPRE